ncbi:MAG: type I-E CRISPR-associated protein Cas7/Cse4/CasC [Desulfomonile tiedjei]|nr:type I-E CRISPR-associated protein Cas7/Cse4/CasC [Desulfomonile tiedjei]
MDKNFINFHILISHSPSCLNRDDMNMQKSAIFGGKRRVRISSQSLKRTLRKSAYYRQHIGEQSIRSRDLQLLEKEFKNLYKAEFEEPVIREALKRFVEAKADDEADEDVAEGNERGSEKKIAVAPWIKEEFAILCQIVKQVREAGLTGEEKQKATQAFEKQKGKKKKALDEFMYGAFGKKIEKRMTDHVEALKKSVSSAVDVALSGRMATSGLMTSIDGALAVAHAITTHTVDADLDWFTAVDDLQELGSGHLDTQEFSSGVFYRYASLNLSQLQENLGNASREKALEIAAHVLHMLATEVPSAKQQSFAAHNLADLAMVSFADIPVSLANAFEEPVRPGSSGGLLKPSVDAFHKYCQLIREGYGLEERCGEFVIGDFQSPKGVKSVAGLEALKAWVRDNGGE